MKLSVVIPVHNEEGCIRETVTDLHDALKSSDINHEILVVNDHSDDQTRLVLSSLQRDVPTLRFIDNDSPCGFGLAVRKGLDAFTGDAVCIMMGDGSDFPEDLITFFRALERGYDCVFGSRFKRESNLIDYPWKKLILNRMTNILISLLFQINYFDVTNAFKMYRAHVIHAVRPFSSRNFSLTAELPLKSIIRGYSYVVVPNSWRNRRTGQSKLRILEQGTSYLHVIIECFLQRLFARKERFGT